MNILPDLNIVLDFLIPQRKGHSLSKKVYEIIESQKYTLWISASSVDNLKYILVGIAKRYKMNIKYIIAAFNKYIQKVKIFSVSGYSIREALNAKDLEDHIIYTNFKRVAPEGIVISNDKSFKNYPDVITPEEFIRNHTNYSVSKTIPILDLKAEYRYILEEIDQAILKNIAEAKYILGPEVKSLEDKMAEYLGVKHCIGVASGTDALLLSLRALAMIRKGKEFWEREDLIITTPFTFTATGDTILRAGATPLFVDIDVNTYNIDPAEIKSALKKFGKRVVGIVPVHLYGLPCYMDEIMQLAREFDLFVLEDTAQAFGAKWEDKKVGTLGDVGAFSFFPSKNLGAFGDAGMVATNDDKIAELIRMLRVHGGRDKYNVEILGYKSRLDTLQAGILLVKLKYIDELNEKRRKIAQIYNEGLKEIEGIVLPLLTDGYVYHQYTIRVLNGKRDALQMHLRERGVESMVYYPVPLHKMKVFEGRCKVFGDLKEAEKASREVLSLPIEPLMKEEEVYRVIEAIKEFFK